MMEGMMVGVIAVVAAQGDMARAIEALVTSIGHTPVVFATTAAFIGALGAVVPDLALTADLDLVRKVRAGKAAPDLPIILLTPGLDDERLVAGLRAGADDHLCPLAKAPVLLARIAAVLRRTAGWSRVAIQDQDAGGVTFDETRGLVTIDGEARVLTAKEFQLARLLFQNPHRALCRRYLIEAVWGAAMNPGSRTLDTHMCRLKVKLGLTPERGFEFGPVYGYGYRLRRTMAAAA
jgi:DNA-binding response OmpR family regulator